MQFLRYSVVGGVAFVADFGTLYSLTEFFGLHYLISAAIAFLSGLVTNYLLCIKGVFENHVLKSRFSEFIIFATIGLVGLVMNELALWCFTERVGIHYLKSKIACAILVFNFNFLARKLILYR